MPRFNLDAVRNTPSGGGTAPTPSNRRFNLEAVRGGGNGLLDTILSPKGLKTGAVTAGGLALLGLLARRPGALGKLGQGINTFRQQMFLTGLALPKSILGGFGALGERALEQGSLEPVRQLFKRETPRALGRAFRGFEEVGPTPGVGFNASRFALPGRAIGAFDTMFRNVLERAGASPTEAQAALLQAPLDPRLSKALENPVARFAIPFRRTPFNQFIEGLGKFGELDKPGVRRSVGTALGAGGVLGAATADQDFPGAVPLGIAAGGRLGGAVGAGALLGRTLRGGSARSGIASSILPVSEFGIESSVRDPLGFITDPPAVRILKRFLGKR